MQSPINVMHMVPRPLRSIGNSLLYRVGLNRPPHTTPEMEFRSHAYLRHNQRRQEHLASLHLPIAGSTVLEVAAGIGDHTSFFLDRGCTVVSTEGRHENLANLRRRFPSIEVRYLDLEHPLDAGGEFDIVYCYGALYHLQHPAEALTFLSNCCLKMFLLETCVSYGDLQAVNLVDEQRDNPSQSVVGRGCRPTRPWVHHQLSQHFEHVYIPFTQPNHEEFPLDWTAVPLPNLLARSVFIASRQPIQNPLLSTELLLHQLRQG